MTKLTRREFVKTAGVAGAVISSGCRRLAPSAGVLGANDEIRVAVCGVRSQGHANAQEFMSLAGVRVVAFCDPDKQILADRIQSMEKQFDGARIDGHVDYREVLDRDDVDAVCIATPNHWHSLMGIHACQAGKDVYVQKPVSHTIWEGRQLVKAAHKYGRIVQAGTQNRSDVGLREFYPYLDAGNLGKIKSVRGLCYRNRAGIGKSDTPVAPPASVNYDLWLGPAQDKPIYRPQFHYDWHWDWNTGNGDIGNQGPHEMDLIRWALGDKSLPTRVVSFGGRFAWDDAGTTPNMQFAVYEYGDVPVFFEVRNLWINPETNAAPNYMGCRVGVIIDCENGCFVGGRGGGWVYDTSGNKVKQFAGDGGKGHFANFIKAMRSRNESDLNARVELGHRSACLSHMANVSYRLGSPMSPDELREHMTDDKEAIDAIERYSDHLAEWNVDLVKTPWTVGISLGFDPDTERFTGDGLLAQKANKMLHRSDRKPYVLPKTV